jgi:hypothetical protein
MHQVGVYVYRSKGTVEEYIQESTSTRPRSTSEILDLRRKGFRANMGVNYEAFPKRHRARRRE